MARTVNSTHVLTYATEAAVVIATLLVYRLAAERGKEGLDAYVLARRAISFVHPLLMVGLAVGLPRMVAFTRDPELRRAYLLASLRIILVLCAFLLMAGIFIPTTTAFVLLGAKVFDKLILPVTIMVLGLCLHTVTYSYLRGIQRMDQANYIQLLVLVVLPVLMFQVTDDLHALLLWTGLAWCLAPLPWLLPFLWGVPFKLAREQRSALLRYGLPRIPGDLAFAALLSIPTILAAQRYGTDMGGRVGLAITLLNIVGAAFAPISLLLLPQAAAMLGKGEFAELDVRIARLERTTMLVSTGMLIAVMAAIGYALPLYLHGVDTAPYVPICRGVFLAAPALAYFVALRSLLDAYHTSPRNGVNLVRAFALTGLLLVILYALNDAGEWTGASVVAGLYYLAFLTWRDVRNIRTVLRERASGATHPVRLVMVIPGQASGNELPFARRQSNALSNQGMEVTTFFFEGRTSIRGLWNARRAFHACCDQVRPDVVHAQYGTVTALFTVLFSPAPVVVTFHGSDLNVTPTDGRIRDLLGRFMSQVAAFFAAGIICVSKGLRDQLWWRREEVQILPMGVDLDHFRPMDRGACRAELGWSTDEYIILFNGNNPALKRIDIAEQVETLLKARGIKVRLHVLTGMIEASRMPVLMNASNALLLCSDREGSPTMVKEAMACGIPVVSNDVGDVRERTEGVTPGAVVAHDAFALADALYEVLVHVGRSNGRERSVENGIDAAAIDRATFNYLHRIAGR
jgi:teichuronic acid biosynthesis glycosyltransferase TuaC